MATKAAYLAPKGLFEMVYGPEERARISSLVEIGDHPHEPEDISKDPSPLSDVEVLFGTWGMPELTPEFLRHLPKLKIVLYSAGSVRGFTPESFWDCNVRLCSAWAMNAIPVAEWTVAQITLGLKQGYRFMEWVRKHRAYPKDRACFGLYGTTVGLISLGMIAKRVVERLKTYDMKVIAYDPYASPEVENSLNLKLVGLEELFQQADAVSLHTPWLKETEGMIREEHFRMMKPGAVFLNTARGAVVDEPGMIRALRERPDLEAILDVTFPEPPPPESPLYDLPNVRLTPHIAGSMNNECRRMARAMAEECERYLTGQPLQFELTRERAATMA